MWEQKCLELFQRELSKLVDNGWIANRVSDFTYELTDAVGEVVFCTCYVEQYLDKPRYSVFMKFNDDLAVLGTVAILPDEEAFRAFDVDGVEVIFPVVKYAEIGLAKAMNLFSFADFKIYDAAMKRLDSVANERKFYLDLDACVLFMVCFKDAVEVERVQFKSTKAKMEAALKKLA